MSTSDQVVATGNMFHSRSHIGEGDIVIVYLNRTDYLALTITKGDVLHNKYGRYLHNDMIGLRFGTKMTSPPPQAGYIYLLRPTPELWTKSLPHRTQILYQPDISYITMRLGIRAGGKVLEAGTGSGSMTHSLSRIVGPSGYVGSYEYHHTRYLKAREEFTTHGLTNVRLQHRNVCKDGFGDVGGVEAVFLDLPAPWEAIPHLMGILRDDVIAKVCCFSPCMEQVTKTCSTLREYGFGDVSTQEVLIRTYELPPAPTSSVKPLRDITSIVADLKAHEERKAERRVTQMKNAREKAARLKHEQAAKEAAANASGVVPDANTASEPRGETEIGSKRKLEEGEGEGSAAVKRMRTGEQPGSKVSVDKEAATKTIEETDDAADQDTDEREWLPPPEPDPTTLFKQILLRIQPEMRGHTSYLTFATLPPKIIRDALNAQEAPAKTPALTSATAPAPASAAHAPAPVSVFAPTVASAVAPTPAESSGSIGNSKLAEATQPSAPRRLGGNGPKKSQKAQQAKAARRAAASSASVTDSQTEVAETEYGDKELDQALGTLTEEEMFAMLSAD